MSHDDRRPELLKLLDELDRLAEEQRLIDVRDPDALAECERKLDDLRRRIDRLQRPKGNGFGGRSLTAEARCSHLRL